MKPAHSRHTKPSVYLRYSSSLDAIPIAIFSVQIGCGQYRFFIHLAQVGHRMNAMTVVRK